ncbi:hypothetical protein JCM8202_005226 [Rhodotorula sphaerocarpa]
MDAQPGPSRAPASAGSAREPAGASSSSSSSASGASAGGARPGAFSKNTAAARPAGSSAAGPSSVAQGKQPAQATATGGGPGTPTGGPQGASSSATGAAAQRTAPAPRPQGQQSGAVNSGTGPVSVAGPAGLVRRQVLNSILVNTRQNGNPVIGHIRQVPWEYGDIKCDYQVGATAGVLYLSIRYHLLHPEYIHQRISDLGGSYNLRIILVQCDADNHTAAMKELTKIALINGYTLMTCWTAQEAGRYLESYKQLERKPPDMIRERVDDSYMAHLTSALTSVRGVNKTDVTTLVSNFGSFSSIVLASPAALSTLPGVGDKKVRRLREAFTAPFTLQSRNKKRKTVGEAEKRGQSGEQMLN